MRGLAPQPHGALPEPGDLELRCPQRTAALDIGIAIAACEHPDRSYTIVADGRRSCLSRTYSRSCHRAMSRREAGGCSRQLWRPR